nr:uncharacterized protein LOC108018486 isoform X1 [Drosophila suzukii]
MPAHSGGQKYINSRAAQEASRGQPLSERTFACGQSRNTVTGTRGSNSNNNATTTLLPPCCLPTPTRNSNNNVATNEGDGRNEGGTAKSEWISVGAAKTTTSGGGRSIAPYPHTHTPQLFL